MARLAKRKVIEKIIEHNGNISAVARAFQQPRSAVYKFCKEKYPELWSVVEEAREIMKDDAESELYRQIRKGNTTALIFYLKTQAKDRGYVERQEHAGVKDAPLYIVNWDDADDPG